MSDSPILLRLLLGEEGGGIQYFLEGGAQSSSLSHSEAQTPAAGAARAASAHVSPQKNHARQLFALKVGFSFCTISLNQWGLNTIHEIKQLGGRILLADISAAVLRVRVCWGGYNVANSAFLLAPCHLPKMSGIRETTTQVNKLSKSSHSGALSTSAVFVRGKKKAAFNLFFWGGVGLLSFFSFLLTTYVP